MRYWRRAIGSILFFACLESTAQAGTDLVAAARERVGVTIAYDPRYQALNYPGGDVENDRGVCTDVVIRAMRVAYGFDLQKAVHEDMTVAFEAYPTHWGLGKPDANIDHRRVPNLEVFLTRQGARIPLGQKASDFQPGDIVTWRVGGRLPHIGVVSDALSEAGVPLIIHNMGWGAREEDILFAFPPAKQFRFHPNSLENPLD